MGGTEVVRSRYPRKGQRLAPVALRELLQIPVAADLVAQSERPGLLLCDLDAAAWERFDESTCRQLGNEIVKAVGLAVRTPLALDARPIPILPTGIMLDDLDLESRTINCLIDAGMRERLQDLREMTIGRLLGLPGFWAKSLVDLLVSLEEASEKPHGSPSGRDTPLVPLEFRDGKYRYPHPGRVLAPRTLREMLLGEIPSSFQRSEHWKGVRLCDLDESVWEHFQPRAIELLADLVVRHVTGAGRNRLLRQRRLPAPPPGLSLEDLCLETRTHRCLVREGYDKDLCRLGELTIERLMAIRAFGAKCLVDLLSAIEAHIANHGHFDEGLTAAAEQLAATPGAGTISFTDPRLGPSLRSMDSESHTLGEMCDRLRDRKLDPPDPRRLAQQLRDLRATITEMSKLPVEEECLQICAADASPRDRKIIAAQFDWDGGGQRTLGQIGEVYGLTRERVRQICVHVTRRNHGYKVFSPVLDRVLAFLASRVPARLDALQAAFDAEGFSACRIRVESLLQAARLLGYPLPFVKIEAGGGHVAVPLGQQDFPAVILRVASRPSFTIGIGSVAELVDQLAEQESEPISEELTRVTLEAMTPACWLDEQGKWFCLPGPAQSTVRGVLEKVLAVTQEVSADVLRAALLRQRRMRPKTLPPISVLLEFCRRIPNVEIENERIRAATEFDRKSVLSNTEHAMWSILRDRGGVLGRLEFEEASRQRGINVSSFQAVLLSSPIIRSFDRGVFGLVGATPAPDFLLAASLRRRPPAAASVLRGFGRKDDGVTFLAYRLSRAAIVGGVVSVPAAIRPFLASTYTLRSVDGRKLGTLATKDGCGWGIGPALRRENAREGDHVLLLLDAAKGEAKIHIGDESLLKNLPIA